MNNNKKDRKSGERSLDDAVYQQELDYCDGSKREWASRLAKFRRPAAVLTSQGSNSV